MYLTLKLERKLVIYLVAFHSLRLHIELLTSSHQIPQTTQRQNFPKSCRFQKGQSVLLTIHSRLLNQRAIRKPSRRCRWNTQTDLPHPNPPESQIAEVEDYAEKRSCL